jgi:hypothetical protein
MSNVTNLAAQNTSGERMLTSHEPLPFRGSPPNRTDHVLNQTTLFDPTPWYAAMPEPDFCWPHALASQPLYATDMPTVRRVINRSDVFSKFQDVRSPQDAIHAYVYAGVWSAGTRARSRTRVLGPLVTAADSGTLSTLGASLIDAITLVRQSSAPEAYGALHGKGRGEGSLRIHKLGPSYGTKILYFAAYEEYGRDMRPLILDSRVATALNWLRGTEWSTQGAWNRSQYAEYLEVAETSAEKWGCEPDVVERALFAIGKSNWLAVQSLAGTLGPPL